MRIAFIGVGQVGAPLADHLQRLGHTVVVAAKDPASASVQKALARNPQLLVAARRLAVAVPELVFLATPNEANVAVVNAVAATKGITSYWSAMNGFVKSITIKPKVHPSATGAAASALCL
ncbi:MAG: NAD(P)-binding domain-containing protein [Cyanobacteriota bacterium]